jgi:hypothetical protein
MTTPLVEKMKREFPELIAEALAARKAGTQRPAEPSDLWELSERCFIEALGDNADAVLEKMKAPMRDFMLLGAMNKARRLLAFDCTCNSDPLGRCTLHPEGG